MVLILDGHSEIGARVQGAISDFKNLFRSRAITLVIFSPSMKDYIPSCARKHILSYHLI